MEIAEVLNALERITGPFPREAVQAAIDRREESTPELLRILEDTIAKAADLAYDDETYFAHMYALYLLAQFRETRAYPLVIALCRLDEEILDNLLGDFITEDLPCVLASVCDGDTAPIERLIEDPAVYEYVRDAALDSLVILVAEGDKERDEVMAYFKTLFEGKLERSASQVWNGLVAAANDLHPVDVYGHIEAAFREGLADPWFISPKSIEQSLGKDASAVRADLFARNRRYITDTIRSMQSWECFRQRKQAAENLSQKPRTIEPSLRSSKAGPNEPCPCGSGKKYKKCCGSVV